MRFFASEKGDGWIGWHSVYHDTHDVPWRWVLDLGKQALGMEGLD